MGNDSEVTDDNKSTLDNEIDTALVPMLCKILDMSTTIF
jgi:hypothetical protein